jgi:ribosomal peptide maturation radical SAM protein 1
MERKMQVLLISMPFGALERQALGLSILKACLRERGIACDVRYLNFAFAGLIGVPDYHWINYETPYTAFAGDWCFTEQLYGERPAEDARYIEEQLRGQWRFTDPALRRLLRIRALTGHFLKYCLQAVPFHQYGMVGFTSTFEQNIASLALASRIKQLWPRIPVAFGGANWEGAMGLELHRQFPFVDFVCSGESEISFPALVEAVRGARPVDAIPGIVYRAGTQSVSTGVADAIPDLDRLPVPDHSDYFRDLASSGVNPDVMPVLLFESSRGCWWGAKSHCTFCGLNGGSIAFRSKSPQRALDELSSLSRRWQITMVEAVDNILDMSYFQDFLPGIVERHLGVHLFYEVKANLSRRHLRMLAGAGARRIQPGIESMSDHVLKLMRKGTTALQNVQLLKWSREYEITAEWNLLYGFPGETQQDYDEMLAMLPSIRFLNPPCACGPLRLDRFSPYFDHPADYGISNIRSISSCRYLYPFPEAVLRNISYYFDFDYPPGQDPRAFAGPVIRYVEEWKSDRETGALNAIRTAGGQLQLLDTRRSAAIPSLKLGGLEQAAYEYCDSAHSLSSIVRYLSGRFPNVAFDADNVRGFLDSAVANQLMLRHGDRYLSLALATPGLREELEHLQMAPEKSSQLVMLHS